MRVWDAIRVKAESPDHSLGPGARGPAGEPVGSPRWIPPSGTPSEPRAPHRPLSPGRRHLSHGCRPLSPGRRPLSPGRRPLSCGCRPLSHRHGALWRSQVMKLAVAGSPPRPGMLTGLGAVSLPSMRQRETPRGAGSEPTKSESGGCTPCPQAMELALLSSFSP